MPQQPGTTQPPAGNTLKTDPSELFDRSMANTSTAAFQSAAPAKVANAAAFTEMRQHIRKLYEGVNVTDGFVPGARTYDCIPAEQRSSVRMLDLNGIAAPAPSELQTAPPHVDGATVREQSGEATVSESSTSLRRLTDRRVNDGA